jgi:hypothetical protein
MTDRPRNGGDWRFTPPPAAAPSHVGGDHRFTAWPAAAPSRVGGDYRFTAPPPVATMPIGTASARSTPAAPAAWSPPHRSAGAPPAASGGGGGGEALGLLLVGAVVALFVLCRILGRVLLWLLPRVARLLGLVLVAVAGLVVGGVRRVRSRRRARPVSGAAWAWAPLPGAITTTADSPLELGPGPRP